MTRRGEIVVGYLPSRVELISYVNRFSGL